MKSSINREVSVKRVIKALKDTDKKSWTVHLTGGEPLLYPNIIGVCKELTNHFEIAINSNLSINSKIREFAHNIDPGKVQYVYASTHIIERERRKGVEDFIDNLMLLKQKRFNVVVNYIFHPSLKRRFLRDYEYFKSRQVKLLPQPFKGIHNLRIYPDWYSEDEKRIILKYTSDEARFPFYSKGLECDAGRKFIKIDPDGTVTRCIADHSILGNVFEGIRLNNRPEPCKLQVCPCIGLEYIEEAEKNYRSRYHCKNAALA